MLWLKIDYGSLFSFKILVNGLTFWTDLAWVNSEYIQSWHYKQPYSLVYLEIFRVAMENHHIEVNHHRHHHHHHLQHHLNILCIYIDIYIYIYDIYIYIYISIHVIYNWFMLHSKLLNHQRLFALSRTSAGWEWFLAGQETLHGWLEESGPKICPWVGSMVPVER